MREHQDSFSAMKVSNQCTKIGWFHAITFLVVQSAEKSTDAFSLLSDSRRWAGPINVGVCLSATDSTASPSTKSPNNPIRDRRKAKRWNGNYRRASKNLSDVPKSKKLQLELSVQHSNGTVATQSLQKKRQETLQHVLTKAILWKLYCDEYPDLGIERDIGDPNYLPDVIGLDHDDRPLFWGESGRMKVHKAMDLMQRYPQAHIVHARWDMTLDEISGPLQDHLQDLLDSDSLGDLPGRTGRFTFCSLPLEVWKFVDEDTGMIHVKRNDIDWKELEFPTIKTPEKSRSSQIE